MCVCSVQLAPLLAEGDYLAVLGHESVAHVWQRTQRESIQSMVWVLWVLCILRMGPVCAACCVYVLCVCVCVCVCVCACVVCVCVRVPCAVLCVRMHIVRRLSWAPRRLAYAVVSTLPYSRS